MNSLGERILRIDPAQVCVSCHRLTNVAIATRARSVLTMKQCLANW